MGHLIIGVGINRFIKSLNCYYDKPVVKDDSCLCSGTIFVRFSYFSSLIYFMSSGIIYAAVTCNNNLFVKSLYNFFGVVTGKDNGTKLIKNIFIPPNFKCFSL